MSFLYGRRRRHGLFLSSLDLGFWVVLVHHDANCPGDRITRARHNALAPGGRVVCRCSWISNVGIFVSRIQSQLHSLDSVALLTANPVHTQFLL